MPFLRTAKEPKRSFIRLDSREVKRLMDAAPAFMKPVIMFALLTGLRQGNVLKLRWAHVNFKSETISIAASEHKSKDHVVTPLSADALYLLREIYAGSSASYVFVNKFGNPLKEISNSTWKRITVAAKLEGLRFHDLRHNWATNHVEAGTDLLALKELGGWKTLEMVQRYAHPSSDYVLAQANNINISRNTKNDGGPQVLNCDSPNSMRISELKTHLGKQDANVTDNSKGCKYKKSSQVTSFGTKDGTYLLKGSAEKIKNMLFISSLELVPEAGLE